MERRRLGRRRARALVGVPGRTRGVDRKVVALAALVGVDGEQRAGKAQPRLPIVCIGNHGVRERPRGGAEILGRPTSSRTPSARRLAPRPGAGLPIRLQIGLVALGVGLHARMAEGELLRAQGAGAEHGNEKTGEQPESGQHGGNSLAWMAARKIVWRLLYARWRANASAGDD